MAETKKKTTTKTETKAKTAKKAETKVEKVNDINTISPELLAMITAQITEQVKASMQTTTVTTEVTENPSYKSKRNKVKQIDLPLDELVPVRSIFNGTVGFTPRSGRIVIWKENGAIQNLSIQDVLDMDASSSIYLRTPRLIVEDEEVCDYLNLNEIVEMAEKVAVVDEFLTLDIKEIDNILTDLPKGLRENIYSEIVRRIECDEIDSMRVVRLLRTKLNIDF